LIDIELKYIKIYEVSVLGLVFCHNCGNKLSSENVSFCHICGSPTNPSNNASISEQNEPRNTGKVQKSGTKTTTIYIAIIVIGLISLGLFYMYYNVWYQSTQNNGLQSPNEGPLIYEVYSNQNEVIPGAVSYYTVAVPSDAINPKLVGTFQVLNGETIKVEVLLEQGCADPLSSFDCVSIYSVSSNSGNIDLNLEPGNAYYLQFHNDAFLYPSKTVNVDFQLQSNN